PDDFVRMELEEALDRDVRVVPVLVQDVEMPSSEELPDGLRKLARRNALEMSYGRWSYDLGKLTRALDKVAREVAERRQAAERDRAENVRVERAAAERAEADRQAAERIDAQQKAAERAEAERRAAADREAAERAEAERNATQREAPQRQAELEAADPP